MPAMTQRDRSAPGYDGRERIKPPGGDRVDGPGPGQSRRRPILGGVIRTLLHPVRRAPLLMSGRPQTADS